MRAVIAAERVTLRPIADGDVRAITAFTNDPGVSRMVSMIPPVNPQCAVEGWLMITRARAPLQEDFIYAIEADGAFVGVTGAHRRGEGEIEIGYWLGRPYWGAGLATAAARAIVGEARKLGALIATHFHDNPASGRVLEKAGFAYTGETARKFCLGRGESVEMRLMRHVAND